MTHVEEIQLFALLLESDRVGDYSVSIRGYLEKVQYAGIEIRQNTKWLTN